MKVLVIIPAYNEEKSIVSTVNSLIKTNKNIDYIVINDKVDQCVADTYSIIEAAHMRPKRNMNFINKIRHELNEISKGE